MPGSRSDYLEGKQSDEVLGGVAFAAPATVYVALFTAVSADGGTFTEVSGNAYARVALTNNQTNWPALAAGLKSNGVAATFPQATPAGWGEVRGWGIYDASSAGNQLYWGLLVGAEKPFTATTADLLTAPGHGFVDTDQVCVTAISGASLPTGISAGVTYFARDTVGDTFKLALTSGGTAIDLTAAGQGFIGKYLGKTVAALDTPSFAVGDLDITED